MYMPLWHVRKGVPEKPVPHVPEHVSPLQVVGHVNPPLSIVMGPSGVTAAPRKRQDKTVWEGHNHRAADILCFHDTERVVEGHKELLLQCTTCYCEDIPSLLGTFISPRDDTHAQTR